MNNKSNSFNEVQDEIVDLFTEENGDQKFVFLTGAAGTGKTTLLERVKIQVDKKKMVVAPTGLAVLNSENNPKVIDWAVKLISEYGQHNS